MVWRENHRITRFRPNGMPMDRPRHYIYIRDDETGEYWSMSCSPAAEIWKITAAVTA